MITNLRLRGFKRFADQSFDLAPLSVLAGLNGTGKTSVIHALLLAREAADGGTSVRLNGPFGLELGTASDVRNWSSDGKIGIDLIHGSSEGAGWRFVAPAENALYLPVDTRPATPPLAFGEGARAFTYLCAERLGPRSVLGASALPASALEIGVRGEYSAQLIGTLGGRPVPDAARLHPKRNPKAAPLLKYEVEGWLQEIARPVEIEAEDFPGTAVTALKFRAPGGDWVRAPNMGFGVSYALPVVLGGLVAQAGGLFIVENPEAHLHPRGQSNMGTFLAWLAGRGVQVLVETHSDHVLNGIRRAIGEHHYLPHGDAIVHFFDTDAAQAPQVTPLRFTSTGGVSDWPPGFFDQYQEDVAALGRVRRVR